MNREYKHLQSILFVNIVSGKNQMISKLQTSIRCNGRHIKFSKEDLGSNFGDNIVRKDNHKTSNMEHKTDMENKKNFKTIK